jgi:hypothetical protein
MAALAAVVAAAVAAIKIAFDDAREMAADEMAAKLA